jgi:hypothetical protein
MAKTYGKSDPDMAAENLLMETIRGEDVVSILLHPRMPINARPCQLPGSLTVQAILASGRVITVRQNKVGATPKVL